MLGIIEGETLKLRIPSEQQRPLPACVPSRPGWPRERDHEYNIDFKLQQ